MSERQPHVVGIGPNKPCDWCGRSDYCLDPFFCFLSLRKEKEMSCEKCEEMQRGDMTAPYRWGTANIEVKGCDEHVQQVFGALNQIQGLPQKGGGVDSKYGDLHIAGIPPTEPVFVLRAQDAHALYLLREYQALVSSHSPTMEEAMDLVLRRFKSWRPKKLPD